MDFEGARDKTEMVARQRGNKKRFIWRWTYQLHISRYNLRLTRLWSLYASSALPLYLISTSSGRLLSLVCIHDQRRFWYYMVPLVSWLAIISVWSSLTWGFDPIISISFIGTLLCISRPSNYYSGLRHGLKTTTWPSWLLRYHRALLLRPALSVIPRYEIVLLCVLMLSVGLRPLLSVRHWYPLFYAPFFLASLYIFLHCGLRFVAMVLRNSMPPFWFLSAY